MYFFSKLTDLEKIKCIKNISFMTEKKTFLLLKNPFELSYPFFLGGGGCLGVELSSIFDG